MNNFENNVTKFALDFLKLVSSDSNNVLFSPTSLTECLAMILAGARGNTAAEIKTALSFERETDDALHQSLRKILRKINHDEYKGYTLKKANKAYIHHDYPISNTFLGLIMETYQAEAENVDFINRFEKARLKCNKWVEKKTEGKISDLLSAGSVTPLSRLILVNAVYFKGNWCSQFDVHGTRQAKFYVTPTKVVDVAMMHQKKLFRYYDDTQLGIQVVELPYIGNEVSFVVMLPSAHVTIQTLVSSLNSDYLAKLPLKMNATEILLYLPRFKITGSYELEKLLPALNIKDLFDQNKADLSGLSSEQGPLTELYVSAAFHKGFIEVNEEGTEAAVATAMVAKLRCMPPEVCCDKPFIFFIRHVPSNAILFMGQLSDPTKIFIT